MNKIVKQITLAASLLAVSNIHAKSGLDIEVGGGMFAPELSGYVSYGAVSRDKIDINSLNLNNDKYNGNSYIYADFSHFVPVVPNFRIENLQYAFNGTSSAINKNWNDTTITTSTTTNIDITQNDFIFYWPLPMLSTASAGTFDILFGLDVKHIDATIALNNVKTSIDEYIPMGYVGLNVEIPTTPITLEVSAKMVQYDGAELNDINYKISYEIPSFIPSIDINVDFGYKTQNFTIPTSLVDNIDIDLTTKGYIFGINAQF